MEFNLRDHLQIILQFKLMELDVTDKIENLRFSKMSDCRSGQDRKCMYF